MDDKTDGLHQCVRLFYISGDVCEHFLEHVLFFSFSKSNISHQLYNDQLFKNKYCIRKYLKMTSEYKINKPKHRVVQGNALLSYS